MDSLEKYYYKQVEDSLKVNNLIALSTQYLSLGS